MLKKSIVIFLLFFVLSNYSQEENLVDEDFPILPICNLIPENLQKKCFEESIQEHIEKYFIYPKTALDLRLQSVVNVFFEINENGEVNNITAKSNLVGVKFDSEEALLAANQLFENAAQDIVKKLPKMIPGKVNGEPSSFPFKLPITYRMPSDSDQSNEVFLLDSVEWAPLFPGCEDMNSDDSKTCFKEKVDKHFKKYLKFPKKAKDIVAAESIVFVEIIVENDGKIYDITILGPDVFRKETERVIKKLPLMEPGLNNDLPIAVSYTIPVVFKPN